MNNIRFGGFQILPPVVKNIIIINSIMLLATEALSYRFNIDLRRILGLYNFSSPNFYPWQFITNVFMHADFMHLFSNMFSLWMFGSILENVWGGKRFIIFYLVTALGGGILHLMANSYDIYRITEALNSFILDPNIETFRALPSLINVDPVAIAEVDRRIAEGAINNVLIHDVTMAYQNLIDLKNQIPTVGASGAVFGVLLAFGMLFPNTELYLFFAFPIKAKYFVAMYGLLEIYLGISNNPTDNIAHFAHLGGMLFGFFMVKYWNKKNRNTFY